LIHEVRDERAPLVPVCRLRCAPTIVKHGLRGIERQIVRHKAQLDDRSNINLIGNQVIPCGEDLAKALLQEQLEKKGPKERGECKNSYIIHVGATVQVSGHIIIKDGMVSNEGEAYILDSPCELGPPVLTQSKGGMAAAHTRQQRLDCLQGGSVHSGRRGDIDGHSGREGVRGTARCHTHHKHHTRHTGRLPHTRCSHPRGGGLWFLFFRNFGFGDSCRRHQE
jgi:hypothetical protein